jgi:trafficking protein particle complex subunit 8
VSLLIHVKFTILLSAAAVPIRTPAEQPIRLHTWQLRFYSAESMIQIPPESADAHLRQLLDQARGSAESLPDLQHLMQTAVSNNATPWYDAYRDRYLRMLRFGTHETMDQPVVCEWDSFRWSEK